MTIAQVPGGNPSAKHGTVILFRVLDQTSVLLGVEELVRGHAAIAPGVIGGVPLELHDLTDHLVFARFGEVKTSGVAVRLAVFTKLFETRIPIARAAARIWVDLLQILDD